MRGWKLGPFTPEDVIHDIDKGEQWVEPPTLADTLREARELLADTPALVDIDAKIAEVRGEA